MPELENLLAVLAAFFVVTVSPGPANIAVATVSMSAGRTAGLQMGLGLSIGLTFWGCIAATGLGAVLQSSTTALLVLEIFGALYLLWLAFVSGRSALQESREGPVVVAGRRWFRRGLLLNLSNPKAVVAWLAALSVGLGAETDPVALVIATLACMALGFVNYTAHALLFSLSGFMAGYRRARRWIEGMAAALFASAVFGLLRSAFAR